MTLKEVRGLIYNEYEDSQVLPQSKWAKIIGCDPTTVIAAANRGGARIEKRPPSGKRRHEQRVMYVEDFPKIVDGFSQSHSLYENHPYHPWSQNVDLTEDFEVTVPSGAVLRYEYPHVDNDENFNPRW